MPGAVECLPYPGRCGRDWRQVKRKNSMFLCPLKWFTVQGRNLHTSVYETSQTGDRKKEIEESLQSRFLDCWKRENRVARWEDVERALRVERALTGLVSLTAAVHPVSLKHKVKWQEDVWRALGEFGKGIECHPSQSWSNSVRSEKPFEAFEWSVEGWHALWKNETWRQFGG